MGKKQTPRNSSSSAFITISLCALYLLILLTNSSRSMLASLAHSRRYIGDKSSNCTAEERERWASSILRRCIIEHDRLPLPSPTLSLLGAKLVFSLLTRIVSL